MKISVSKFVLADLDIDEITLLTAEEASQLPIDILHSESWWWLKSPGYYQPYNVSSVHFDGKWICFEDRCDRDDGGIRPAIKVADSDTSGLTTGAKIAFGGYCWTMVLPQTLLCDSIIEYRCWREDSTAADANDWEKSDIKKWLEEWVEKSLNS